MEEQTNGFESTTDESSVVTDNQSNEVDIESAIDKALDRPVNEDNQNPSVEETSTEETTDEIKTEDKKDNIETQCPKKFVNEDGSVNVENLIKSYKALEPLISEKANWENQQKELLEYKKLYDEQVQATEQQAINAGYNSYEDMQQIFQIASAEANEYAKYLEYVEDPEIVRQMLIEYANNPSKELLSEIEMEFTPDINKNVAILSYELNRNYEIEKESREQEANESTIRGVIDFAVNRNRDLFDYEPFQQLFVNTLQRYGTNFTNQDAEVLLDAMIQMKDLISKNVEQTYGIRLENDNATNRMPSMTSNNAPARSYSNVNDLTPEELSKEIDKYI